MIELRRLRAFVALAEEGHVTRAAERLGMHQPGLTRLLSGLETELSVRPMDRHPRGVRPTEAGRVLLSEARAVLVRAHGLEEIVRRAARDESGRLSLGVTHSAALHPLFPRVLRQLRTDFPGVAIELEEAVTGDLMDALLHERLDAAFMRVAVGPLPELRIDPVFEEYMLAARPIGHPLAAFGGPLALQELAGEPFILYATRPGRLLNDTILAACRVAGFSPTVAHEPPRLAATITLVAAGFGVSIAPASIRRLGGEDVVFRTLSDDIPLWAPICLGTKRSNISPTVQRFRQLVKKKSVKVST